MQKLFVLGLVVLGWAGAARAAAYGVAGCGLGSIVFKDTPGAAQITASTLNGIGMQSSGITTGTSNCGSGVIEVKQKSAAHQQVFVEVNYASLMRDAAAGDGAYVAALGALLGCSEAALPTFVQLTQAQHAQLFVADAPAQALTNIRQAASADPRLRTTCTDL